VGSLRMIYQNGRYDVERTDRDGEYRLVDKVHATSMYFNSVKIWKDRIELRILRSNPGYLSGELRSPEHLPRGLVSELEAIAEKTGSSNTLKT
jgi:hypothetical protein